MIEIILYKFILSLLYVISLMNYFLSCYKINLYIIHQLLFSWLLF